jgi:hypothetical protein
MTLRCSLAITALLAAAMLPSRTAGQERSPFAGDTRLDTLVSVKAPLISLRAALGEVERQCHAPLTAADDIAGETVVLLAQNRPAQEALAELAAALGYTWTRKQTASGDRLYQLEESPEAKRIALQRRLEYRRAAAAELERWVGLMERAIEQFGSLSNAEFDQQHQAMEARVKEMPDGPARLAAEEEDFAVSYSREPQMRAFVATYRALPPPIRDRLFLGERILMGTRAPATFPLPPAASEALAFFHRRPLPRGVRGPAEIEPGPHDDLADLTGHMYRGHLAVRFRVRRPRLGAGGALSTSLPRFMLTSSRVVYGPRLAEEAPGKVTADREADLQQLVRCVISNAKSPRPDEPRFYCLGFMLSDALDSVNRFMPAQNVAGDAYFKALRSLRPAPVEGLPPLPDPPEAAFARLTRNGGADGNLPLRALLQEFAVRGDTNVHLRANGWLHFRSTIYFEDRERAVDPNLLLRLFRAAVESGRVSPEVWMTAAEQLGYPQVLGLSEPALRFLEGTTLNRTGLPEMLDVWKLAAGLESSTRADLFAGRSVNVSRLSRAERARFESFIRDVSQHDGEEPLDLELEPRDIGQLAIALAPAGPAGANGSRSRQFELRVLPNNDVILRRSVAADWEPKAPKPQ